MARKAKIKQKPSQKVGGGDYFDGNFYYSGTVPEYGDQGDGFVGGISRLAGQGAPITKKQYEQLLKDRAEKEKVYAELEKKYAGRELTPKDIAEIEQKYGKGAVIAVQAPEDDYYARSRGPTYQIAPRQNYVGAEPVKQGSNFMPQMDIPEYDLEGRVDMSPQRIAARREGYDDRTTRKIGMLGSKTNRAINDMNQAKLDHLRMVDETNRQIGKPEAGAYKGFSNHSVNQAIAYAMDKQKESAKKHWANAANAAKSVKANAEARGAQLQKQFDAAGGQANQANRMQSILNHMIKRQQNTASTQAAVQQTHGLINSGTATKGLSPFEGNSIADTLRPQGMIA
jgi:hypothetical protein